MAEVRQQSISQKQSLNTKECDAHQASGFVRSAVLTSSLYRLISAENSVIQNSAKMGNRNWSAALEGPI